MIKGGGEWVFGSVFFFPFSFVEETVVVQSFFFFRFLFAFWENAGALRF